MTGSLPAAPPPDDARLRAILLRTRVIAMVGVSPNPIRPSHYVGRYLAQRGYRIVPVNPAAAGQKLWGETVRAGLDGIAPGDAVDMLDLFRRPEEVSAIVAEALERLPGLRTVWMQLGITSPEAAAMARARGLEVIEDRCPKIEHQRLFGELRKAGINTGIISSRR